MVKKLCLLALFGTLTFFVGSSQNNQNSETYIQQIKDLKQNNCKLSLGLEALMDEETPKNSSKWITKGNKVLVDAFPIENIESLKNDLTALGVTEMKTRGNMVSGWIDMDNISKLNTCATLSRVVPEFKPTTNIGLTTSQAVSTLFSAEASKIFDVNGEGIKIGILSDSFNARGDAETTVASGDIPGVSNPNGFTTSVEIVSEIEDLEIGSDEGRGMAELIHDIAPSAELAFYSAFNGFFDFADGIRALRAVGCDVIVDDIGYFASPYFQDSAIAQAVDEVVADGAIYLSSAGNSGQNSYEDEYKEVVVGDLSFYDFGGGDFTQALSVAPGENIFLWFQWDDPSIFANPEGPLPDTDLDVLLFDVITGDLLDSSIFFNPVDGFPIEIIDFTNETEEPVIVELLVQRFSGPAPRRLKYINNGNADLTFLEDFAGNGAGTCYGHSNAAGAIAVGAQAYVFNTEFENLGFGANTATSLNSFSSFGGVPILIDDDGNDIEPIDRQKPDVVGTDFTNTTSFPNPAEPFFDIEEDGLPNFGGTSAAAPHVAAIVALMLQENPDLTPQEVWTILDETALDMDDPTTEDFDIGYDSATGRGFVQGDKALAALQEEPTVYRYQAYNSTTNEFIATLTDSSNIYLDEVEGGLINIVVLATDGLEDVKSTRFTLSGTDNRTVQENKVPFALFGDDGQGNFRNWEVSTGDYELSSIAFDQLNTQGNSGNTYSIGFGVDYLATISSFILVDADSNTDIGPLEDTIEASFLESYPNLTIRAEVSSPVIDTTYVEKVRFNLTGAVQRHKEDISAPYSLFGDNNGDFQSWEPSPIIGTYTLEATPFARRNGTGTAGTTTSFSFEIIDSTLLSANNNDISLDVTSGILTVESLTEDVVAYSVFDSNGIAIFKGETSQNKTSTVDLAGYGRGLYIIKSEDGEVLNAKILLQ